MPRPGLQFLQLWLQSRRCLITSLASGESPYRPRRIELAVDGWTAFVPPASGLCLTEIRSLDHVGKERLCVNTHRRPQTVITVITLPLLRLPEAVIFAGVFCLCVLAHRPPIPSVVPSRLIVLTNHTRPQVPQPKRQRRNS